MDSELKALVQSIPGFSGWNHADKIRFFAWFLHTKRGQDRFTGTQIGKCFDALHLQKPTSISPYLTGMGKATQKDLLRDSRGWHLEWRVREGFDQKYGTREITIQTTQLLENLPDSVPELAEKDFLKETLICYRHGAFRAAIVMCWNLTFFHLCEYIVKHHMAAFNAAYPKCFEGIWKKAKAQTIAKYQDFSVDLKESHVNEIAKSARIISADIFKILDRQLDRRNTAAHPASVHIGQLQAEELIQDLITNVVLALPL